MLTAAAALVPCGPRPAAAPAPPATAAPSAHADLGVSSGDWLDLTPRMRRSAQAPAAAEDCAAIFDPVAHRMVLFGGKDDANQNRAEIWELDLDRFDWRRIPVAGDAPPPSEDHTLIFDPVGYR